MTTAEEPLERNRLGNCNSASCVARDVLSKLATKWASLVLRQLAGGERRYSQIRDAIGGISEKMLAQTLRELERDGLVRRTSFPVVPPHVVYALTPLGRDCAEQVSALVNWIEVHLGDLQGARRAFDSERAARRAPRAG
ncbi:MAG TPA: helix-turn-helix domain-containing protein [Candidatus Sulfotelmatobacter sp.]|nr:helix-turn-helix domain-containing protein [Candidatus Sulfotelmatobacter sp.]